MTASPPLLLLFLKAFACTKMRAIWRCGKREGFFYLLWDAEKHRFCKRYSQVFGVKELVIFMSTEEGRKGRICFTFEAKKPGSVWQAERQRFNFSTRSRERKKGGAREHEKKQEKFPPHPSPSLLFLREKKGETCKYFHSPVSPPLLFYMLPSLPLLQQNDVVSINAPSLLKREGRKKTMGKFLPK